MAACSDARCEKKWKLSFYSTKFTCYDGNSNSAYRFIFFPNKLLHGITVVLHIRLLSASISPLKIKTKSTAMTMTTTTRTAPNKSSHKLSLDTGHTHTHTRTPILVCLFVYGRQKLLRGIGYTRILVKLFTLTFATHICHSAHRRAA